MERGEDQVPGEGRLHRHFCRFQVSGFPKHDDVRVLTEECAECGGEGHTDRVIDRHLHDTFQVVFHRVFGGEDLIFDLIDFFECGVKGGGLTGTGRTGDDEDPVRHGDNVADLVQDIFVDPEHIQVQVHHGAVEHAEHHGFAELGGQGGYTEVNGVAGNAELNTAVLRFSAFGNVQAGHDLHAGDDRDRQVFGGGRHFVERTVDTVTDLEFFFKRLKVNVRGFIFHCLIEHGVHELDDRRFAGGVFQVMFVQVCQTVLQFHFGEHVLHGSHIHGIIFFQEAVDLSFGRDNNNDILVEHEAQFVPDLVVEGVAHGDSERCAVKAQRHHAQHTGSVAGDHIDHTFLNFHVREVHHFGAQVCGDHFQKLVFHDHIIVDQQFLQGFR